MNKTTPFTLAMIAMALIACSGAVARAQYIFVELNVPAVNAASTTVYGISNDNLITGTFSDSANGTVYGFTFNPNADVWQYPISDPNGLGTTWVTSSNTAGTIVGSYVNKAELTLGMVDREGTFSGINAAGCDEGTTSIYGINDSTTPAMIGWCLHNGQPVSWIGSPQNVTFSCPGAVATEVAAIGNWLISVGTFYTSATAANGFIATDSGTCTTFNHPGAYATWLAGINDYGTISGTYMAHANGPQSGFLTNGNGTFTTIDYPGAKTTVLGQVNNNGWFVGNFIDPQGITHAFYALPAN